MGSQIPQVGMIGYFRRRVSQPNSGFFFSRYWGIQLGFDYLGFSVTLCTGGMTVECDGKKTRYTPMFVAIAISLLSTSAGTTSEIGD